MSRAIRFGDRNDRLSGFVAGLLYRARQDEEIGALTRAPKLEERVASRPVNLDGMAVRANAEHPDLQMLFLSWEPDKPLIYAILASSLDAGEDQTKIVTFDARNGDKIVVSPRNHARAWQPR